MTVIATDGKTIAADSRSTTGDLIISDATEKLVEGKDGSILGAAGPTGAIALVRDWFEKGEDLSTIPTLRLVPEEEWEGLILRPDGSVYLLDGNFTLVPVDTPAAIGSGCEVAIGLMLAGKSPEEAIPIVASRVATVGGAVCSLKPKKKGSK